MNILFLSGVGWHSIKQRPQFMAKYLDRAEGNKVTFISFYNFGRGYIKNDDTLQKKQKVIPRLPFVRFKIIRTINSLIGKLFLSLFYTKNDLIIITNPSFFQLIKTAKLPVVYDCMDDWVAYEKSERHKKIIYANECDLIEKAALVLFSSSYLREVVTKRNHADFKSILLNNAIHIPPSAIDSRFGEKFIVSGKRNIAYIGAIFNWFDYELIRRVALKNNDRQFNLFGPAEGNFPPVENIRFCGIQDHKDIFPIMESHDALIMPFKLNDLIRSVNPIKLYEYIYSGKPVISIQYGETLCFEKYVYLYEAGNIKSLQAIFNMLEENNYTPKKSPAEMKAFALENTWEKRIEILQEVLKHELATNC